MIQKLSPPPSCHTSSFCVFLFSSFFFRLFCLFCLPKKDEKRQSDVWGLEVWGLSKCLYVWFFWSSCLSAKCWFYFISLFFYKFHIWLVGNYQITNLNGSLKNVTMMLKPKMFNLKVQYTWIIQKQHESLLTKLSTCISFVNNEKFIVNFITPPNQNKNVIIFILVTNEGRGYQHFTQ